MSDPNELFETLTKATLSSSALALHYLGFTVEGVHRLVDESFSALHKGDELRRRGYTERQVCHQIVDEVFDPEGPPLYDPEGDE